MGKIIGARWFVSNQGDMIIQQFPTGLTGFCGDWTDGEKALFEQLCEITLDRLDDDATPVDICLALGWKEITQGEADSIGLNKSLKQNIQEGRLVITGKNENGELTFKMTESGRIYVDSYMTARAKDSKSKAYRDSLLAMKIKSGED